MDHLIGAIDYHEWADVCCWYRSARASGYDGKIVLFVFEHTTDDTLRKLELFDIEIIHAKAERSVNRDRFKLISHYCKSLPKGDRVLTTDVRDVAFYTNVSDVLDAGFGSKRLFIASEGWKYGDSPWNRSVLENHFPWMLEPLSDEIVYCSGVIGGYADAFSDLSIAVYDECRKASGFAGDQAGWNYILRQPEYRDLVNFLPIASGVVAHMGVGDATARKEFFSHKHEEAPRFDWVSVRAVSEDGTPFLVLHQYTRFLWMRTLVLARFGCLWDFFGGKLLVKLKNSMGLSPQWTPYWKGSPS